MFRLLVGVATAALMLEMTVDLIVRLVLSIIDAASSSSSSSSSPHWLLLSLEEG